MLGSFKAGKQDLLEDYGWDLGGGGEVGWPRNGYLVIPRNTKLDEIKHFFRGISAEFREIPRKDFAKISHIFAKYFRGISWYISIIRGHVLSWHCILQMPNLINSLFILSFMW